MQTKFILKIFTIALTTNLCSIAGVSNAAADFEVKISNYGSTNLKVGCQNTDKGDCNYNFDTSGVTIGPSYRTQTLRIGPHRDGTTLESKGDIKIEDSTNRANQCRISYHLKNKGLHEEIQSIEVDTDTGNLKYRCFANFSSTSFPYKAEITIPKDAAP